MTCKCGAEFCLLCGCDYNSRSDQCEQECPSSGPPIYNEDGYDIDGYDRAGFDKRGRDHQGLTLHGFNIHHVSSNGRVEPGWEIGPNGNARRWIPEPPPASVSKCAHIMYRCDGSGVCMCCAWEAYRFVFTCKLCPMTACSSCLDDDRELDQEALRQLYPFFEDESFEIWKLFADNGET